MIFPASYLQLQPQLWMHLRTLNTSYITAKLVCCFWSINFPFNALPRSLSVVLVFTGAKPKPKSKCEKKTFGLFFRWRQQQRCFHIVVVVLDVVVQLLAKQQTWNNTHYDAADDDDEMILEHKQNNKKRRSSKDERKQKFHFVTFKILSWRAKLFSVGNFCDKARAPQWNNMLPVLL